MPPAPRKLIAPPPLAPSPLHGDGVRRCWPPSYASSAAALPAYHDAEFGRAHPPGSGRLLFKQLVLQTFQAGLSWAIVLGKADGFEKRFEGWDYGRVAQWTPADVDAALADAAIVRNGAKIRAAVENAAAAARLDAAAPRGFEAFLWQTCGGLPSAERLLQHGSRTEGGSYMRASTREDFMTADGVHVTPGVADVARRLKAAGFRFLGPATTLSFLQAAGFVNHHKPDCAAFAPAEAAYAAAAAAFAAESAGVEGGGGEGALEGRPRRGAAAAAGRAAAAPAQSARRGRASAATSGGGAPEPGTAATGAGHASIGATTAPRVKRARRAS